MRYAIISDLHANRQAWESVLADITSYEVDAIICLGDVVGYGPTPQLVLDQVRQWCAAVVIGNHDAAACGRMDASIFNDEAKMVVEWTRGRIDADGHQFLNELPAAVEDDEVLFVHAEVIDPERFDYITEPQVAAENLAACGHRLVFVGHTHEQAVFVERSGVVHECAAKDFELVDGCRYLVNVGSVGEPRDPDDLRARYVIFDSATGEVGFRAVDFDFRGYREDIDREGLPVVPYFLQACEANAAAREALELPREPAMRLIPISEAAEHRDKRVVPPSRLVVVPLPTGRGASNSNPDKSVLTTPRAPQQQLIYESPGHPSSSSKSGLVWLLLLILMGGLALWYFKFRPHDGSVDIESQLDAELEERVIDVRADMAD